MLCFPKLISHFPMPLFRLPEHKIGIFVRFASNFSAQRPLPATNLIWRRRSPVWLAIWHIWAGFANSQMRCATFSSTY